MLESKTREPAMRSAGGNVNSKPGSPPGSGSKGDGLFEKELSSLADRKTGAAEPKESEREREAKRPRRDEARATAKTDKTENLRSHSGAGTDSRKSKAERSEGPDQKNSERVMLRRHGDRFAKDSRESLDGTASVDARMRNLASRAQSTHEDAADSTTGSIVEPQENSHEESPVREPSGIRSRRLESETSEDLPKTARLSEANHIADESEDESIDLDPEVALAGVNQATSSKLLHDPKLTNQTKLTVEGSAATADVAPAQQESKQVEEGVPAKSPDFSPKQKAMLELLQGMQKDLGVSPETMLKAFGGMSEASLEAPPEQTLKEFIGKLTSEAQLTPRESAKATALYGKFLGEHAQAEFDETLGGIKVAGSIQDGSMGRAVIENLDRRVEDLQGSLKSLTANGQTPDQLQAEISRLMQTSQALKSGKTSDDSAKVLLGAEVDSEEAGLSDVSGAELKDLTVDSDKNFAAAMAGRTLGDNAGSAAGGQSGFSGNSQGQPSPFQQATVKASSTSSNQVSSTGAKGSLRGEMEQAMKAMSGDSGTVDGSSSSRAAAASVSTIPFNGKSNATVTGESSGLQGQRNSLMSPKDEEANVKELMRQAQLIVKKGGGEMKLEMSPEGMGKVHLKVGVENGQVSVQMLAESDAAKKMLENNLGDLRASLVAHKLHVDQLKVDTKVEANADVSKQMDQQMRGDANREQGRQAARDFMSEFRDDREGFRQGFFSDPRGRGYARQVRSDVKPDAVSTLSARKMSAASRLNLVA